MIKALNDDLYAALCSCNHWREMSKSCQSLFYFRYSVEIADTEGSIEIPPDVHFLPITCVKSHGAGAKTMQGLSPLVSPSETFCMSPCTEDVQCYEYGPNLSLFCQSWYVGTV